MQLGIASRDGLYGEHRILPISFFGEIQNPGFVSLKYKLFLIPNRGFSWQNDAA